MIINRVVKIAGIGECVCLAATVWHSEYVKLWFSSPVFAQALRIEAADGGYAVIQSIISQISGRGDKLLPLECWEDDMIGDESVVIYSKAADNAARLFFDFIDTYDYSQTDQMNRVLSALRKAGFNGGGSYVIAKTDYECVLYGEMPMARVAVYAALLQLQYESACFMLELRELHLKHCVQPEPMVIMIDGAEITITHG